MSLPASSLLNFEFCINCGNDVDQLVEETGWCIDCSPGYIVSDSGGIQLVTNKAQSALIVNADAVQHFITTGATDSVWEALSLATQDRPICIVCGERIKRARRHAMFCRSHAECRRIARRYIYLYQEKGLSKTTAFAQILSELTGE